MKHGIGIGKTIAIAIAAFLLLTAVIGSVADRARTKQMAAEKQKRMTTADSPTPAATRSEPPRSEPPKPTPAPAPVAPTTSTVPPVGVSAEQLRKDYNANEVSADEKYLGKVLDVTGIVAGVKKDVFNEPFVELSTANQFMSVQARFDGDTSVLGKFMRGDKLVVRCIGNNVTIGSPQLKGCALQHQYRRDR